MAEFTDVIPKEGYRTPSIQGKLAGALGVHTPGAGRQHAWGFTQGHWGALGPCHWLASKRAMFVHSRPHSGSAGICCLLWVLFS